MKRALPKRILALFWAALFLLNSTGEAFGAHVCLYHDAPAASHLGHGPSHAPAPPAGDHHPDPAAESDGHSEPCTCVFVCETSAGSAVAAESPGTPEQPLAIDLHPSIEGPQSALPRNLPHVLPFANAPPALG